MITRLIVIVFLIFGNINLTLAEELILINKKRINNATITNYRVRCTNCTKNFNKSPTTKYQVYKALNRKNFYSYDYGKSWSEKRLIPDKQEITNLQIYPNPAGDFINLSVDSELNLLARDVQILNLLGIVVSKTELRDGNNRIDISNLSRGTYFIRVGDKVDRFVKL